MNPVDGKCSKPTPSNRVNVARVATHRKPSSVCASPVMASAGNPSSRSHFFTDQSESAAAPLALPRTEATRKTRKARQGATTATLLAYPPCRFASMPLCACTWPRWARFDASRVACVECYQRLEVKPRHLPAARFHDASHVNYLSKAALAPGC